MTKETATFTFQQNFNATGGGERSIKIILAIDFKKKEYSILPSGHKDTFKFHCSKPNNGMWLAVADQIKKAVCYAEDQLKLHQQQSNG